MSEQQLIEVENDLCEEDLQAEWAMMRQRAERVRRRLHTNVALPMPAIGEGTAPQAEPPG